MFAAMQFNIFCILFIHQKNEKIKMYKIHILPAALYGTGEWRKPHNGEFHILNYYSASVIREI
jgi:hypothetical protein